MEITSNAQKMGLIRVLCVDDDCEFLEVSKEILTMEGNFEVGTASSVDEAFQKIVTEQYDIIIADYEMPKKNGLDFLKELREQKNEIPFILFTGKGREEIVINALNLGADGYVNKQGSPETVYGELSHILKQIAERQKTEQELIRSQSKYGFLFSNMVSGFAYCKMIFDEDKKPVDFVYLEVNDAFTKLTGLKKETVLGKKVTEAIPGIEKTNPELFEIYGRTVLTGKEAQFEFFFIPLNIWLSVSVYRPEKGYFIALFENITERKKADLELRRINEILERVGEGIDAGLAIISRDYNVIWANKHLMDLGVASNKKCYQTFNRSETVCLDCGARKVFEQNIPLSVHEFKTVNSKGETVWIELRASPLKDNDGNVEAALELAVPITERKEIEDKLRESQHFTQKILDCSPNLIYIYDLLGNCNVYANREVLNFLGYTPEQIKTMDSKLFENILHPEDAEIVAKHHARFANAPDNATYDIEYRMKHVSGGWRWLRSRDTLFARTKEGAGKQILGTCEDITEHKKAEETLSDSEAKYRALVENAEDVILLTDLNGKHIYRNPAYYKTLGFDKSDKDSLDGFANVHLEDLPKIKEAMSELLKTGSVTTEYRVKHHNGSWLFRHAKSTLIYNKNREPYAILAIIRDITENKKAEAEILSLAKFTNENPFAVFRVDKNGVVLYTNPPAQKLPGSLEIRVGVSLSERWQKIIGEALESKCQFELEEEADGRYFSFSVVPIVSKGYVNVYGSEITRRKQAEAGLLKSKALLIEAEREGKVGGFEFDVNTLIQKWTEETFRILEIDTVYGEPTVPEGIEFINPEYRSMANEAIQRAIEHGEPYDQEWEITTKKGNKRWVRSLGKANWENGKIKSISGYIQDITERKKSEGTLRKSEERYRDLANSLPEIVFETDMDGNLTFANQGAFKISGYTQEDFAKGICVFDMIEQKEKAKVNFKKTISNKPTTENEYIFVRKDGSTFPIIIIGKPIVVEGNTVGLRGLVIDITERKKAEEALKESEEKSKAIVVNAPIGIATSGVDKHFISANKTFCRILGYTEDELRKLTFQDITHPEDLQESATKMEELENNKVFSFALEKRYIKKDGTKIYGKVIVSTVRNQNGEPSLFTAELEDITERKKIEDTLRLSEEKHRAISSITADCLFSCVRAGTGDFVIDWMTGATEKVFGYSIEEIKKRGCWKFVVAPEDLPIFKEKVVGLRPGQSKICELRINHKDGSARWIKVSSQVKKDSSNSTNYRLFGACRDITERKETEQDLKMSEQKYRELVDSLPGIIFEADETGKLTFANQKGREILGYSNDELKQMTVFQFLVHSDMQRAKENFQSRLKGDISAGNEYTLLRKDGSKFPALVHTKQGINLDGKPVLSGVIINLTESKSIAKSLSVLNEKLRVVGSLARHDVRNKLLAVESNVYLAKKKLPPESVALNYLSRIDSTVDQIAEIFDFTNAYEKLGLEKLVYMDAEKTVEESAKLLSDPQCVKINNNCHGLSVLADSLLKQLFFNLIDNSLKHGKQVSQIRIYYQKENKGNLSLVYEDNGVGIPCAEKPKLFTAGYTTGGGTGYGLYLIKKTIEVYGWTIQENGEPGKGAKFTITIPEKNQENKESYCLLSK